MIISVFFPTLLGVFSAIIIFFRLLSFISFYFYFYFILFFRRKDYVWVMRRAADRCVGSMDQGR